MSALFLFLNFVWSDLYFCNQKLVRAINVVTSQNISYNLQTYLRDKIYCKLDKHILTCNTVYANFVFLFTLYKMGEGAKRSPTNFFYVTSINVEISLQNFLTFSFNPFATLV